MVFSLFGDIHLYILDQNSLSEIFRHCALNLNYNESTTALAGFASDENSNIANCNNACWALGEVFVSCSIKPS